MAIVDVSVYSNFISHFGHFDIVTTSAPECCAIGMLGTNVD